MDKERDCGISLNRLKKLGDFVNVIGVVKNMKQSSPLVNYFFVIFMHFY